MRRLLASAFACALAVLPAARASAAEPDDLPTGDDAPRFVPVAIADTYWAWHDPQPSFRQATLLTTANRHNEFQVNLAAIGAKLQHSKLTGTLVLQAGTSVDANYATSASREIWKHIQEANAGWRSGNLHLEAGVFTSLIGREDFVSTRNWNYTRAFLSDSIPYYIAGARVTYRLAPAWSASATVFNGWQTFTNTDNRPAGNLYVAYKGEKLQVENSTMFIPDRIGERSYERIFEDLIVTLRLHSKVEVAAEGYLGIDHRARVEDPTKATREFLSVTKNPWFYGGLLWARWKFATTTWIAARGEIVFDQHGVLTGRGARDLVDQFQLPTKPGQRLLGGTLTFGWQPHPSFLTRIEVLHRVSDQPWFAGGDTLDPKKSSTTFVVSAAFAL